MYKKYLYIIDLNLKGLKHLVNEMCQPLVVFSAIQ